MLALQLVTILCSAPLDNALEIVMDNYGCLVDSSFTNIIDGFHNGLRQSVAKGGLTINGKDLGPARQMYGLIYDCSLEKEAKHETKLPGYAALFKRGMIRFSSDFEGSAVKAMEGLLKKLYEDEDSLKQLIYPKATRYGCWGTLQRNKKTGKRHMGWVCVYDKKPREGESPEGSFCTRNEDCTFYKDSTCEWNLCYTQ